MQSLILFSCLVAAASAWNCPQLPVVEKLNVTALAGTWYQQSMAGAAFFVQPGGTCAKVEFAEDTTGESLFTFKNTENVLIKALEVDGYATYATSDQNGKLRYTVTSYLFDPSTDMWVLDTDYDNYLVLFSCTKAFGIPAQASWILRRAQNPTGDDKIALDVLIDQAFEKIAAAGGPDLNDFAETDQSHC